MNDIGKRIAAMREALGLNQVELAKKAQVARSSISEIESGKNQPNYRTLTQIAEALGTTVGSLVEGKIPVSSLADMLPEEMQEFLLTQEGMQYLKISMKAKDFSITPDVLNQIVEAMKSINVDKTRT
jgi:transcriptional regulator with XRE-family HTH domain